MNRSSLRFVSCAVLVGAGLCLGSPPALSQTAPAHAPPDAAEADRLFEVGKKAYAASQNAPDESGRKAKLREARDAYLRAFEGKQTYDICGNLANTEVELGKRGEPRMKAAAAQHYDQCVTLFPPSDKKLATAKKKTEQKRAAARAEVATLTIHASVEGAEVLVDGDLAGKAPLQGTLYADPGPHTIEARLPKYTAEPQKVQVAKGEPRVVELTLAPTPEPPPPATASTAPAADATTAPPGTGTPPVEPVPVVEKRPIWPALTAGSVGVVGLVVGTGLTVAANGQRTAAENLRTQLGAGQSTCSGSPSASLAQRCKALYDGAASRDALSKGAAASFVLGGAAGVAAVGLGVWAASRPDGVRDTKSTLRVTPVAGAGVAGVLLEGAW